VSEEELVDVLISALTQFKASHHERNFPSE